MSKVLFLKIILIFKRVEVFGKVFIKTGETEQNSKKIETSAWLVGHVAKRKIEILLIFFLSKLNTKYLNVTIYIGGKLENTKQKMIRPDWLINTIGPTSNYLLIGPSN